MILGGVEIGVGDSRWQITRRLSAVFDLKSLGDALLDGGPAREVYNQVEVECGDLLKSPKEDNGR